MERERGNNMIMVFNENISSLNYAVMEIVII